MPSCGVDIQVQLGRPPRLYCPPLAARRSSAIRVRACALVRSRCDYTETHTLMSGQLESFHTASLRSGSRNPAGGLRQACRGHGKAGVRGFSADPANPVGPLSADLLHRVVHSQGHRICGQKIVRIKAMPSHGGPSASEPSIDDAGVTLPAADSRLLEPENRPGCAARQLDH